LSQSTPLTEVPPVVWYWSKRKETRKNVVWVTSATLGLLFALINT
jgi:hypothetical protein